MKSIIVGTAGHIDHGKTTLVRALTGIDADRLPEEKRRGITCIRNLNHLFFCPEQYRRTREPSSARAFSENPGVALSEAREVFQIAPLARTQSERRRRLALASGFRLSDCLE
jgi:translation initiation factor 2 gamma subunit (eIF-2gamma)